MGKSQKFSDSQYWLQEDNWKWIVSETALSEKYGFWEGNKGEVLPCRDEEGGGGGD